MSRPKSKPIALQRRKNPFALAVLVAAGAGVVLVPAMYLAGEPALALILGVVAIAAIYICVNAAWKWVGTRAEPLAKNEKVAFSTWARSSTAHSGIVSVTNSRIFYEPSATLLLPGRKGTPATWDIPLRDVLHIRRESQDRKRKSRGGAQFIVVETKGKSWWLQPREFDNLANAIAKATGKPFEQ